MSPHVVVSGKRLALSNLNKVVYPETGFTKGDLIDYYRRIAPAILPHLRGRPVTLVRFPDGVSGKSFFEKRCPPHRPEWVSTTPVYSKGKGRDVRFCLVEDVPTLVWLANLAAIELHPQLALGGSLERPTALVFDLDPGPPAGLLDCARVALGLRELLSALDLEGHVKTSGGKGLQVYVPLRDATYGETKPFARALARILEERHPERIVSNMRKDLRAGKVFIDWSQNDEHKTTVCVYSVRARLRPTVSTPLEWSEVRRALEKDDARALVFETEQVIERVSRRGDIFAPVLSASRRSPILDATRRGRRAA